MCLELKSSMFSRASLRLTAWYVAILMGLSLIFSVWVYNLAINEVRQGLDSQLMRPFAAQLPRHEVVTFLDDEFDASRGRIVINLILLNSGVLILGSAVSYALARRTLRPIEDALESQNIFAADASHELRTPLASIKTENEVALRNDDLNKDELRAVISSNLEEVDRMSRLVNDLLALTRSADNMEMSVIDAQEIISEAEKRWSAIAAEKQIQFDVVIKQRHALGNSAAVTTVLNTLLDNAIKYSPTGSTITISTLKQETQTCVTVHNDGVIGKQDLPHIFDRFYRADKSRTKDATHGHGLGLSIAKKLVEHMRGSIAVRSENGKGTTITFRLRAE